MRKEIIKLFEAFATVKPESKELADLRTKEKNLYNVLLMVIAKKDVNLIKKYSDMVTERTRLENIEYFSRGLELGLNLGQNNND